MANGSFFLLRSAAPAFKLKLDPYSCGAALRKVFSSFLIVAILVLAGINFRQWRARYVVSAAAEFMPTTAVHVIIPAGTRIDVSLKNLFSTSTKTDDRIWAFVTDPVIVNGSTAIPAGARLDGVIDQITKIEARAVTSLHFDSLVIGEKSLHIETEPLQINASVESDFEILGNALGTVASTGIGVAIGAAGGTESGVAAGATAGAIRGAAAVNDSNIEIILVLAQPIEVIR
jgi:hypothetical protein